MSVSWAILSPTNVLALFALSSSCLVSAHGLRSGGYKMDSVTAVFLQSSPLRCSLLSFVGSTVRLLICSSFICSSLIGLTRHRSTVRSSIHLPATLVEAHSDFFASNVPHHIFAFSLLPGRCIRPAGRHPSDREPSADVVAEMHGQRLHDPLDCCRLGQQLALAPLGQQHHEVSCRFVFYPTPFSSSRL